MILKLAKILYAFVLNNIYNFIKSNQFKEYVKKILLEYY